MSWYLGSESSSFSEFIFNMRQGVGHPYLWFAMLYFISHFVTPNIESMKIIHLTISTLSVFLILKYAPFNKIIRVMLVFGYFLFYEYSIISRNYALGVLFIIIFCILYKNKYKNILLISLNLFFLGQVNIFSFIISICLALFLLIEILMDWKLQKSEINKINLVLAFLIVISEIMLEFWQLGSQFRGSSIGTFSKFISSPIDGFLEGIFRISRGLISAYLSLPKININFFNSNFIVDSLFNSNYILTLLLGFILFIFPLFIIKRRYIIFYLFTSFSIMLIPLYIYKCFNRHFGHFFLIFLICLWLSEINGDELYILKYKKINIKAIRNIFLIVVLSISLAGSAVALYYDFKYLFSNGKNVAIFIKENFDEDNVAIIGYPDYSAETISIYLNKSIYYPNSKDIKKLVQWNKRVSTVNYNVIFSEANTFAVGDNKVLVIIGGAPAEETAVPSYYRLIDRKFTNAIIPSENYNLYLFDKNSLELKLIYKMDNITFNNYWRPLNQCEFIVENGKVKIKVKGDDPWFESKFPLEFKNKNSLMLNMIIDSSVEGEVRIFYGRYGKEFIWEDSDGYTLIKGRNNIYIMIPFSENLEKIRIDPVDSCNDCIIERIELYNLGK